MDVRNVMGPIASYTSSIYAELGDLRPEEHAVQDFSATRSPQRLRLQ